MFNFLQLPHEKPEPTDTLIEPKSEYLEENEESVEDLTLDDDMNDLNEMEQDNNRAGPSHDPSQHPGKFKTLQKKKQKIFHFALSYDDFGSRYSEKKFERDLSKDKSTEIR